MARQSSLVQFEGSIDNISFFKTKNGYQARKKTGVSSTKILNDPAFARTRENMAEFSTAAKAAKLVRRALREVTLGSQDGRMSQRFGSKILEIVKQDASHARGARTVTDLSIVNLKGFEFNVAAPLATVLLPQLTAEFARAENTCSVNIKGYIPAKSIARVPAATHYRIVMGTALVDFEKGEYITNTAQTGYLSMDALAPTSDLLLETALDANPSTAPAFCVLTLEFFLLSADNKYYPIQVGAFNACAIVEVFTAP